MAIIANTVPQGIVGRAMRQNPQPNGPQTVLPGQQNGALGGVMSGVTTPIGIGGTPITGPMPIAHDPGMAASGEQNIGINGANALNGGASTVGGTQQPVGAPGSNGALGAGVQTLPPAGTQPAYQMPAKNADGSYTLAGGVTAPAGFDVHSQADRQALYGSLATALGTTQGNLTGTQEKPVTDFFQAQRQAQQAQRQQAQLAVQQGRGGPSALTGLQSHITQMQQAAAQGVPGAAQKLAQAQQWMARLTSQT